MKYETYGNGKGEVASITLFYNVAKEKEKYYKEAMEALFNAEGLNEVFYVVNGKRETLEKVRAMIDEIGVPSGKKIHLIYVDKNLGFARANNIGYKVMRKVSPHVKYLALVNDDLKIYKKSIKLLRIPFEVDDLAAASTGIVYFWNKAGVWRSYHLEPLFLKRFGGIMAPTVYVCKKPFFLKVMKRVAMPTWVQCGFSLFSVKAIESCGFFWHGFFLYGEDEEFSIRLWRCGHRLYYLPVPAGEHLVHGSGTKESANIYKKLGRFSNAYIVSLRGIRGLLGYILYYLPKDFVIFLHLMFKKLINVQYRVDDLYLPYLAILLEKGSGEVPAKKLKQKEPLICVSDNPFLDVIKLGVIEPEDLCPLRPFVEFVEENFIDDSASSGLFTLQTAERSSRMSSSH